MKLADRDDIPQDIREAVTKALEPHPVEKARNARFFGVELVEFDKDELIQIAAWVAENSRDKRRDS